MMSTRITSLSGRFGVRRCIATVRAWSGRQKLAVGGAVFLVSLLGACTIPSTSTYPVDIFTAMHYQETFDAGEPQRFLAPDGAVPVQGRAPVYSPEEINQLENPIPPDAESLAIGQRVYNVNCAVCHGDQGNGDGPMAAQFTTYQANPPAVLTADRLQQVPDSHFYNVTTNGLGQFMPAFGNLIPGDEIWNLINYVRELQRAGQ